MKTTAGNGDAKSSAADIALHLRVSIESACMRLLTQYCVSADRHDLNMFLDVFSLDAEWERPAGGKLSGHAEISAFFEQRSKDEKTCHVTSNALICVEGPALATGTSLATVYRHTGERTQVLDLSPQSIVEYRDEFTKDGAGRWRIRRRSSESILRAAAKQTRGTGDHHELP